MEKAVITRQLKIFCPTHQSVFEVAEKPQIICEIREHALSNNFPQSEFWEYCCDCRTFSPSQFGTGGKARETCRHCERLSARRFLCSECKIVSCDSNEDTKGKFFRINAEKGVEPNCPGCQKSIHGANLYQHQCSDIDGVLFTIRVECPFCQKSTISKPPQKQAESFPANTAQNLDRQAAPTQCPNCGHWGRAERTLCGKCGRQINVRGEGVAPGTTAPRTQLLGSICPNCGAGNEADSVFCVNCGQALKIVSQTKTEAVSRPIFAPPILINQPNAFSAEQTFAPPDYQPQKSAFNSKILLFVLFGGLVFLVFGLLAYSSRRKTETNSNNANYTNYGKSTYNSTRANSSNSNYSAMNTNRTNTTSGSSLIGRKGRLTTNLNLRIAPDRYAETRGTHYENARLEILDSASFYADDGEYVTWYKVKILQNGCDRVGTNGCGNNWERNGYKGYGEAETEGWMNSKYIVLE